MAPMHERFFMGFFVNIRARDTFKKKIFLSFHLQFRAMLRHNPWGKPGGGAPNSSVRLRNITLDGLHPEQKLVSIRF
jgi:hypothetical protein